MTEYVAGLIISPYGRKFEWQVETDVDMLSCEIYEFNRITAQNKQEAVNILNKKYGYVYGGKGIKTRPFSWGNGWW